MSWKALLLISLLWLSMLLMTKAARTDVFVQPMHEQAIEVLIAKVPLSDWTLVKRPEEFFIRELHPPYLIPSDAIHGYSELKGQTLRNRLCMGQIVRRKDLVIPEDVGRTQTYLRPSGSITLLLDIGAKEPGLRICSGMHVDVCRRIQHPQGFLDKTIVSAALVKAIETSGTESKLTLAALRPEDLQRLQIGVSRQCHFYIRKAAVQRK